MTKSQTEGKKDRLFQCVTERGCFTGGYSFSLGVKFYEDKEINYSDNLQIENGKIYKLTKTEL